jgi:hypothetical protein
MIASEWLLSVAGLARRLNAEAMGESLRDRGSRASHGAAKASPPFGFDPLSQEQPRDGSASNKPLPRIS